MDQSRRAVITGGSSGIGAALARLLANVDIDVLIAGRDETALSTVRDSHPKRIQTVAADLGDPAGIETIARAAGERAVDFLVHAAGTLAPIAPLESLNRDDWLASFAVNLHAPVGLTQALLDRMTHTRILLISSGAAHRPIAHWSAYCCAKAALVRLSECLNLELNSRHILATTARPGVVDTPMQSLIRGQSEAEFPDVQRYRNLHEQGRLHHPETVAAFLAWLLLECSDGAFVGHEWDIDDPDHHPLWRDGE